MVLFIFSECNSNRVTEKWLSYAYRFYDFCLKIHSKYSFWHIFFNNPSSHYSRKRLFDFFIYKNIAVLDIKNRLRTVSEIDF